MTDTLIASLQDKLQARWRTEQICGRLLLEHGLSLSPETVYRLVLKDKQRAGQLYRYLRHQAKPSRNRHGGKEYRGKIPGRVDIVERLAIVDTRSRVGDWEADLVIRQGQKGAHGDLGRSAVKALSGSAYPAQNR